jgi:hypothetical protein
MRVASSFETPTTNRSVMNRSHASRLAVLTTALLFGACGGDEAPATGEQPDAPQNEGLVLDSADFAGIEAANVTFNLHWTQGAVNRDPERLAPPVNEVQEVTTLEGEDYDRVIFHLGEGSIPGYSLTWVEEPAVHCESGEAIQIAGERRLLLRLTAATALPSALGPQDPRYENLQAFASTCVREGGALEWQLGVREQAQVRVIEVRNPRRLVVDVRHDPPSGE